MHRSHPLRKVLGPIKLGPDGDIPFGVDIAPKAVYLYGRHAPGEGAGIGKLPVKDLTGILGNIVEDPILLYQGEVLGKVIPSYTGIQGILRGTGFVDDIGAIPRAGKGYIPIKGAGKAELFRDRHVAQGIDIAIAAAGTGHGPAARKATHLPELVIDDQGAGSIDKSPLITVFHSRPPLGKGEVGAPHGLHHPQAIAVDQTIGAVLGGKGHVRICSKGFRLGKLGGNGDLTGGVFIAP